MTDYKEAPHFGPVFLIILQMFSTEVTLIRDQVLINIVYTIIEFCHCNTRMSIMNSFSVCVF